MERLHEKGSRRSGVPPAPEGPAGGRSRRARERHEPERARGGDAGAVEALVRAHYAEVHAAAFHLLGNREDADDLAQECFVRALEALRRFRGETSPRAWLRRILVHLARDRFRARSRRPSRRELPPDLAARAAQAPAERLSRAELGRLVDAALRELAPPLRMALVLRTLEGWDYDSLARATGVTPQTARTQVMRARRLLHRRLARHLGEPPERRVGRGGGRGGGR